MINCDLVRILKRPFLPGGPGTGGIVPAWLVLRARPS